MRADGRNNRLTQVIMTCANRHDTRETVRSGEGDGMTREKVSDDEVMLSADEAGLLIGRSGRSVLEIPASELPWHETRGARKNPRTGEVLATRGYRKGDVIAYRDARRVGGPVAPVISIAPRGDDGPEAA